ncbi:hypothetical protein VTJ83DRAFT_3929 [Remersonia thermophila]|uniref:Uncharacterized protein n=1 Tax=Remersonia thermophila TaxID=72144 RepID=A0ABR4DFE3_9PEZI
MASRADFAPSLGDTLSYENLLVDCTFPELLARDLERSRDIFLSKDMTAGSPCPGLAAPEPNGVLSMASGLDKGPWLEEVEKTHGYENGPSGSGRSSPDLLSASQKLADGLVSVRTDQLSAIITEATPVSPSSSSPSLSSMPLPALLDLTPCSSNREDSLDGTWFDDEPETPQEGTENYIFTARTSLATLGGLDETRDPADDKAAAPNSPLDLAPLSKQFSVPLPVHFEKPRIIEIPPPAAGKGKALPSHPSRVSPELGPANARDRAASSASAGSVGMVRHRRQLSTESNLSGELGTGPSLLELVNGRTIIDVSTPPCIPLAGRSQDDDSEGSDEEDGISEALELEKAPSADLADPKPSVTKRSLEADACPDACPDAFPDALAPAHSHLTRYPTNSSLASLPLPPNVIESLRASISCFPETMLLTSSLSIETIRAYSKKLRRRSLMDRQFRDPESDTDSAYSSSSPKHSRRWNMADWFDPSRRCNNMAAEKQQQQQVQQWSHATRLAKSLSHVKLSRVLQCPITGRMPSWLKTPSPWAAVANVFPSAPARLCDALYAHLLAYNYVCSHCPSGPRPSGEHQLLGTPQAKNPPLRHRRLSLLQDHQQPSPEATRTARPDPAEGQPNDSGEADDDVAANARRPGTPMSHVPTKAAMFLGIVADAMDKPLPIHAARHGKQPPDPSCRKIQTHLRNLLGKIDPSRPPAQQRNNNRLPAPLSSTQLEKPTSGKPHPSASTPALLEPPPAQAPPSRSPLRSAPRRRRVRPPRPPATTRPG